MEKIILYYTTLEEELKFFEEEVEIKQYNVEDKTFSYVKKYRRKKNKEEKTLNKKLYLMVNMDKINSPLIRLQIKDCVKLWT